MDPPSVPAAVLIALLPRSRKISMRNLKALLRKLLILPWKKARRSDQGLHVEILRPDCERSLPVETIEQILGYLLVERDASPTPISFTRKLLQPTLRTVTLLCRIWYSVATRYLYDEIYLSSPASLIILAKALHNHEGLRPLVHQFYFTNAVYAMGNPEGLLTKKDRRYYMRILDLCPNLHFDSYRKLKMSCDRDQNWLSLLKKCSLMPLVDDSFPNRLTALEMSIPNGALFDDGFWKDIKFPALHILSISCSRHDCITPCQQPQWFQMPQLRCLILRDFIIVAGQELKFPACAPLINTIELLGGDYYHVRDFFYYDKSPFWPYRKTLETLTITAKHVEQHYLLPWSLSFLTSLVELCFPFRSFAKPLGGIQIYPPHLSEFVLIGYVGDSCLEESGTLFSGCCNLKQSLRDKKAGLDELGRRVLPDLKRVRVLVRDVEENPNFCGLIGEYREVRLDLGIKHFPKNIQNRWYKFSSGRE